MSIAIFKKKAKAKYSVGVNFNTVSAPGVGFSLNGISRPVGAVGPTNLGKSVTRTPFRGTEPVGWGGGSRCRLGNSNASRATGCGTGHLLPDGKVDGYPRVISNSGSCCTPQYLMKRSVKNTRGMLESRYTGLLFGGYPRSWVQNVGNALDHSSGQYTEKLAQQPFSRACTGEAPTWTGSSFIATGAGSKEAFGDCGRDPNDPSSFQCKGKRLPYAKDLNLHARDYPAYLKKIKAQCLNPLCAQKPFPYRVSNGACTQVFTTWQEARAAGQLCPDFFGSSSLTQRIRALLNHFRNKYPDLQLAFVKGTVPALPRLNNLTDNTIISKFSSSVQDLIYFINENNTSDYTLVLISKDTKYVSQETHLGLPVYSWPGEPPDYCCDPDKGAGYGECCHKMDQNGNDCACSFPTKRNSAGEASSVAQCDDDPECYAEKTIASVGGRKVHMTNNSGCEAYAVVDGLKLKWGTSGYGGQEKIFVKEGSYLKYKADSCGSSDPSPDFYILPEEDHPDYKIFCKGNLVDGNFTCKDKSYN